MNVLDGYDSEEEYAFNKTDMDWISDDPLLHNIIQIRKDYKILHCVGHGSYSAVFKVENLNTHEIQCAKNYYPEIVNKEITPYSYYDISTHGKREIVTLLTLRHPSILPIHKLYKGRRRGSIYMITDLYDTNLDELIRSNHSLSLNEIKIISHELLSVLDTIHQNGLIHNDLKPSNVLYRKGKIALCDWGSASSIHTVGILPTLAYRSPEMLLWRENSSPQVWTEKVDIWSWGIILLELLSKRYFYEGDSEISAINRVVKLAGTDSLQKDDQELFLRLCTDCHMRFPVVKSELSKEIDERVRDDWKSDSLRDLLAGCLQLMPGSRKTAKELLQSSWWKEEPVVGSVDELPDYSSALQQEREERKKKTMEMWLQLQNSIQYNVCENKQIYECCKASSSNC